MEITLQHHIISFWTCLQGCCLWENLTLAGNDVQAIPWSQELQAYYSSNHNICPPMQRQYSPGGTYKHNPGISAQIWT